MVLCNDTVMSASSPVPSKTLSNPEDHDSNIKVLLVEKSCSQIIIVFKLHKPSFDLKVVLVYSKVVMFFVVRQIRTM